MADVFICAVCLYLTWLTTSPEPLERGGQMPFREWYDLPPRPGPPGVIKLRQEAPEEA